MPTAVLTLDDLIRRSENELAQLRTTRADQTVVIAELRSREVAGETLEDTAIDNALAARDGTDRQIADAELRIANLRREAELDDQATRAAQTSTPTGAQRPAYDGVARVNNEPSVYSRESAAEGTSWFCDSFAFTMHANPHARERLERHGREVEARGQLTERATTTSSFAGLVVPQYLVDQAALIARAGRPVANLVTKLELPDQGMTLVIPRGTTGAATAIQATENSNVQNTDEVWANVNVPVVTIAGQQDVSRQSLERGAPNIDELIYMDLAGAYAVNLDSQVISGTGSSGQMLGILNTAGVNQATAFGAAATPTTFYSKVAGQLNAIETTRFMAPDVIAMHPRRWNWLLLQVDSQGRPLVVPNQSGPFNAFGVAATPPADTPSVSPVGNFMGIPTVTDASIPTAQGSGPEDVVIVMRKEDLLLWEDGDGLPRQLRFEQTLGNQLTVKVVVYGYAAFTAGRYPAAVGLVGGNATAGNGLVAPTF